MARSRTARLFQSQNTRLEFTGDPAGALRDFQQFIQTDVLRSAARAGVLRVYYKMRQLVPVQSGELYASIYHWHNYKLSTPTRQIYETGPNKSKAPHWAIVEYGTVKMAARPYIRPAILAEGRNALRAASDRAREKLAEFTG